MAYVVTGRVHSGWSLSSDGTHSASAGRKAVSNPIAARAIGLSFSLTSLGACRRRTPMPCADLKAPKHASRRDLSDASLRLDPALGLCAACARPLCGVCAMYVRCACGRKISVRRVYRYVQISTRPRRSPSACSEIFFLKK